MSALDNCDKAMRRAMGAGLVAEYIRDGNEFSYELTAEGRKLQATLRAEGNTSGLDPLELASIAYNLHFGDDEQQPLRCIVLNRFEINGRLYVSPMVPVSLGLWRGVCPFCSVEWAATYFVDKDKVFFCTNCGVRGRYREKGTLTRLVSQKEETDERRNEEARGEGPPDTGGQGEGGGPSAGGSTPGTDTGSPGGSRGPGGGTTGGPNPSHN